MLDGFWFEEMKQPSLGVRHDRSCSGSSVVAPEATDTECPHGRQLERNSFRHDDGSLRRLQRIDRRIVEFRQARCGCDRAAGRLRARTLRAPMPVTGVRCSRGLFIVSRRGGEIGRSSGRL